MLDNNDYLRVGFDGFTDDADSDIKVLLYKIRDVFKRSVLTQLPIKRPYMINLSHVEYIEGVWNDEKTEYGIKIGYSSGTTRCFWGSTAKSVLECLSQDGTGDSDEICDKFDNRVKAGPPAV